MFQDILVESDVIALGSINTVMSGKQYNRSVRSHKLMYEALQRLRFRSFYDSAGENLKFIIDEVAKNLDYTNYSSYPLHEFTEIVDSYTAFIDLQSEANPTFHFWSSYIDMVQLLLLYIRATRTSNWKLHLQAIRLMLPWFFVTDRTNYSRYLPCYLIEMKNLNETHPCKYRTFFQMKRYILLLQLCTYSFSHTKNLWHRYFSRRTHCKAFIVYGNSDIKF